MDLKSLTSKVAPRKTVYCASSLSSPFSVFGDSGSPSQGLQSWKKKNEALLDMYQSGLSTRLIKGQRGSSGGKGDRVSKQASKQASEQAEQRRRKIKTIKNMEQ